MIKCPVFKIEYTYGGVKQPEIKMGTDHLFKVINTHYCINCGDLVEQSIRETLPTYVQFFDYRHVDVENEGIYYYCEKPKCVEEYEILKRFNEL